MKRFSTVTLLLALFLILGACSDDGNMEEEAQAEGAQEETGDRSIELSLPSDAVSVDPHGSNDTPSERIREHIFEGLVKQNNEFEIIPSLATEWEQLDELTWQFTLQEGVTFHDGSEFNAEVVKANFDRLLDPGRAASRAHVLEMIEEVTVIDDYIVEIKTEYPFQPLLSHLSHGAGDIISREQINEDYEFALEEAEIDISVEEYYEIRAEGGEEYQEIAEEISQFAGSVVEEHPVGTGYLEFDARTPGESTVLVRNDEYWNGQVNIDQLILRVVPETGSRIAEIETNAAEVIGDVPPSDKERLESNEDTALVETQTVALEYIGMNTESEILQDKRVRQAITHAFNKEAVIEGVYDDAGIEAVSPLAPEIFGHHEELKSLEYDLDEAQRLLEEAGYGDGFGLKMYVNDDNPQRVDTAVWLQESLQEIGIDLEIVQLEWGSFLDALGNQEHDLYIMSWGNSTGDPDNGIRPVFHSDSSNPGANFMYFSNDEADRLMDEGRQEADLEKRQGIYEQVQEILIEEAPAIFILHPTDYNAHLDHIKDIRISPYGEFDFKNVK
ncbi:glutathione ABC transporter substrate-binding protein [Salinicoccus halitifaciens]|uniref:Peptide/nickel transport system substrate-binding protein n=1 Tax=Salinicoccus halitifaciens TaxID=1073415 RepID=A0ABV2E994_9STAP|nr:glutathione ABC transporter substrate-binding protein [Salinicoccus halitifaciens]MCD2137849.1 glutathione ABC transporter substrate-binding protein [Salinicoccus halitifaciens]